MPLENSIVCRKVHIAARKGIFLQESAFSAGKCIVQQFAPGDRNERDLRESFRRIGGGGVQKGAFGVAREVLQGGSTKHYRGVCSSGASLWGFQIMNGNGRLFWDE